MKLILGALPSVCLLEYRGREGEGKPKSWHFSRESGTAGSLQPLRGNGGVLQPPPAPRRTQPPAQAGEHRGPARLVPGRLTALLLLCLPSRVFHVESAL